MALISLIVPVYNAVRYLERAVNSALAQIFDDYELILVDDGSTDGSGELCDRFAAGDGRVRVIHQANGGVSVARNNGIRAASGRYLAFLDADDWLEPDYLSAMYDRIRETGAGTAACGNYLTEAGGAETAEAPPMPAGFYSAEEARRGIVLPLLSDRLCRNPLNGYVIRYLFDAALIRDNGIAFTGAYLEDELFLIAYFSVGSDLAVTDRPLYHYFQNPGSVTRRYLKDYTDTFFKSLALKEDYVRQFAIPVPDDWRDNTCWAGLLIVAANEFAPGNACSVFRKAGNLKQACAMEPFRHAIDHYVPANMNRSKAVVAQCIRRRLYFPLAMLYTAKNINRR